MFSLDTNTLKLFSDENETVVRRVAEHEGAVWLSSVAAEEFFVPYWNTLGKAKSPRISLSLPRAHQDFIGAVGELNTFQVWVYDEAADAIINGFTPEQRRVGAQDCRIAAQALAHNMTIMTRNVRDFVQIGAPCEDGSVGAGAIE